MNQNKFFSSEVEMGSFLATSDVIQNAHDAISKTKLSAVHDPPYNSTSLRHGYHPYDQSGYGVLAFVCSPDRTAEFPLPRPEDMDLVSSKDHPAIDFVGTKVNSSFSVNRAALELFESSIDGILSSFNNQQEKIREKPLIITGQSLGGAVAALVTLWLHHNIDLEESLGSKNTPKRPICITFGSPLVGDDAFQKAISERPAWKSSFLHVVATNDLVPRMFSISSGEEIKYKPFGVFLFCSESGSYACFEEKDSILGVMNALNKQRVDNNWKVDYGEASKALKHKVLYKGISRLGDFNFSSLRAGITLQLLEVGVLITQEDHSNNGLIAQMESKAAKLINSRRNKYEPAKKLNDMKISLTYMEWYMKMGKAKGGYYNSYKKPQSMDDINRKAEVVKQQRFLNQYWKAYVEEKDKTPQTETAKLRARWLYGGQNYRRIVEPLDIAEYYLKGNTNYIAQRSAHYILLERWLENDKKEEDANKRRNKAVSLTEDSCFWAHVEEACISLKALKNPNANSNLESEQQKLLEFETYVMKAISEFLVSPDIFLEGSTFMEWWEEYKAYKGEMYNSHLAQYMNTGRYKSYE